MTSGSHAAFALLPPEVRHLIEQVLRRRQYAFGQVVVREGEDADGWYVVEEGRARVLRTGEDGQEVALGLMQAGEGFGEISLLEGGRRTATVRAAGPLTVLHLDAGVFAALVQSHPEVREAMVRLVRRRQLNDFLRHSSAFSALPPELLGEVLEAVRPRSLVDGEVLYAEGDPAADMAVLRSGRLCIRKRFGGLERDLAWLRPGEVVGERAVLAGGTRSASVVADGPCELLEIPGALVHRMVAESPAFARQSALRERLYQRRDSGTVPLDMADELLPAQAQTAVVSETQVDAAPPGDGGADASSLGPFASPEGHFVQRGRIKRFPYLRQLDAMDCGAASLAMVCRHFGRQVSITRIRAQVGTGYDGTSLSGICDGARALGLAARAVKVSKSRLDQLPLPAIVHLDANHWAVLWDVTADAVKLADPGVGQRTLPRDEFLDRWSGYAALFDYTEAFADAPESTPSVQWLWRFARPFRSSLLRAAGLALVVSALQMVLPVFTQVIVDRVLVEGDVALLHWLVGAMLATMLLMTAASLLQRYLLSWSAVRIDLAAFDFLTRRLLDLPMPYFATRRVGDIQRRLLGARQVREFLVEHGVTMLQAFCQLAAALVVMTLYSWKLSLVFVLLGPLYLGLMRWSRTRMRPLFNDLEEAYGKYASNQIDGIKGIEAVKSMGAEARLRERLLSEFSGLAKKQFDADYTRMAFGGAMQSVDYLARVLFLLLAAHQVIAGAMSIGELVAFTALAALATQPIQTLLSLYDNLQIVAVLVDRLGDVFESEPEQGQDRGHLRPVPTLEGRLTLQNLGFRYGGADAPMILQGISVDIPPGTRVAIVGRSGSGKSTLIKVLTGMLVPSEGRVLYDTVDMATLDFRALRRRIGVVLQESFLFSDSIARNIAFADPEPDEAKVAKAARAAAADGFIERLPLSYHTRVGESGLRLSGGQAQRISIARALYEEPPVLIFDEATSALDSESERAVKENMDQFLAGRTSIVIAHRLSTIRDADLILVLEQGRLVEQGSHDELLAREGLYQYLVSQQLGL
ncbi:MAG: peptidase domain-containing ABC transporter [Alphaproteobacteria bacterium]|nr:peptidase domain-containing ABC transporter [Alphaproteobacteria bacterium]